MKILYFAWLRERTGVAEEEITKPAEVADVSSLLDWIAARGSGFAQALENRTIVRVAVNQEMAACNQPVSDDDEVALFPPVTGGTDKVSR